MTGPPIAGRSSWPSRTPPAATGRASPATQRSRSPVRRKPTTTRSGSGCSATCGAFFSANGTDRLPTALILIELGAIEESPWADLRGRPLGAHGLARLLRPYGVRPRLERIGAEVLRGYQRADFADAWARYLPSLPVSPEDPPNRYTVTPTTTPPASTEATRNGVTDEPVPGGDDDPPARDAVAGGLARVAAGPSTWRCRVDLGSGHVRGERPDGSTICLTCHPLTAASLVPPRDDVSGDGAA